MKILIRSILLLACLLPGLSVAAEPDLYSGSAPVADESPEARNAAVQTILGQVMVRLSGRREILASPAAAGILAQAADLTQQFRYQAAASEGGQKRIRVHFDGTALRRAMAAAGLPVWVGQRPRVLLWVALEQGANRRLLNLGELPEALAAVQQRAHLRGMPLQLPLMDLEDQSALGAADIWADYDTAIRAASARYPHDLVLTARVREQAGGRYSADWTLWRDAGNRNFTTQGQGLARVLAEGIDAAQDLLAQRLAVQGGTDGDRVRVRVEGVDRLADYTRLMGRLQTQPGLAGLALLETSRDGLLLGVRAAGGRGAVEAALRAVPGLNQLPGPSQPMDGQAVGAGQDADLYFSLTPAMSDD